MTFDILKVLHIGSMFMATALAVGPLVVMYLVARTQDAPAIARTLLVRRPRSGGWAGRCTASASCSAFWRP